MVIRVEDVDTSRLDPVLIKENFIFGLGFPQSDEMEYIILRCIGRDKLNYWMYDPLEEGMLGTAVPASTSTDGITNHGFVNPSRPSSKKIPSNPSFIFPNPVTASPVGMIYQVFFGVAPDFLRMTLSQPFGNIQMALPVQNQTSQYNQFGTILGKNTPTYKPGPDSEIWVPPNLDFGLGFVNDQPEEANPLLMWVINRIMYERVTDPDVVYEMLNTTKYKSLRTVGGIAPYSYSIKANMGANPVTLGMNKGEIRIALGV